MFSIETVAQIKQFATDFLLNQFEIGHSEKQSDNRKIADIGSARESRELLGLDREDPFVDFLFDLGSREARRCCEYRNRNRRGKGPCSNRQLFSTSSGSASSISCQIL